MTDNDIIKALEHYSGFRLAPYFNYKEGDECIIVDDALDLINRQKAEIERLREHIELLDIEHEAIKISAIKEFAKKIKEEIAVWHFDFTYYSEILEACQRVDNIAKRMVGESK